MKKKIIPLTFIVLCLILCLIPSVGMIFNPTDEAIGNERETPLPSAKTEEGTLNLDYASQLGDYFEKHFAFRSEAITADALIQSKIFENSNSDSVVVGTDGWLYYKSTVDDYLGRDTLSDREINGVVHNLNIINDYCNARGVQFYFTVAPNKNTLYPDNMPYYYSCKASDVHNRDLLNDALKESDINYINLFDVFENQDEVLYFKRDSHWNNKGALLAYNEIMSATGKSYDDYSSAEAVRKKDFVGDLSNMLYPSGYEAEYNYYYGAEDKYSYVTDTQSTEDAFIQTSCENASGCLYMYRDSFGNSLLPYFASAYESATFTKAFPMILQSDLDEAKPDAFIMELVERNIDWLITQPPIILSPELSYYKISSKADNKAEINVKVSENSPDYLEIRGSLESKGLDENAVVYARVTDKSGNTSAYECYSLSTDNDDIGFLAYLSADSFDINEMSDISLIIQNGDEFTELNSENVTIGGNYEN